MNRTCTLALAAALVCAGAAEAAAQAVCAIPVETRITDLTGAPVDGPIDVEITFYDGPGEGAVAIDCRAFASVAIRDGWMRLAVDACALPEPAPSGCGVMTVEEILRAGTAAGAAVWMGVRIGDDEADAAPRTRVGAVPYAVWATASGRADVAESLEGFDPANVAELADLAAYATLADLEDYATLADLAGYAMLTDLDDHPTFVDLSDYATLAALSDYATFVDLSDYATLAALSDYATLAALSDYATRASLSDVATSGAFGDLIGIPEGVEDGDDDTLAALPCSPTQIARVGDDGAWSCGVSTDTLIELDCTPGQFARVGEDGAWACSDGADLVEVLDRLEAVETQLAVIEAASYGTVSTNPGESCLDILETNPSAVTGTYWATLGGDSARIVDCYMGDGGVDEETFGGGWMRLRQGHAVNGRSLTDATLIDPLGYAYTEILFRHRAGTATGGGVYPDSFPTGNAIGWRPEGGGWEATDEVVGSTCGTSFSLVAPGVYLDADFSVALSAPRTARFQVGMTEGIANCTISDNPGGASLDVWVR